MNLRNSLAVVALTVVVGGCAVTRGQESTSNYLSDTAITTDIKARYAADSQVAATSISVETLNGIVQLSGFAKNQAEKDQAAAIARDAKGVKSVKNDIIVRSGG